ncbi:MAG: GTPase HflX [Candidatus Dependentiae bacterium]
MAKKPFYLTKEFPKTMIIGVHAPYNRTPNINAYFDEFKNLVKSSRAHYDTEQYVKIRTIDSAYFITRGKLEDLRKHAEEHNIEEVIISDAVTAQQQRNLEGVFDCKVIDRTGLILEIFEKAAHSAEGKKQVEIAKLQFQKSRLTGKGVSMSQQSKQSSSASGSRGPGETAKENELRYIRNSIYTLRKELARIQRTRIEQRKRRLSSGQLQIALIGYTNAGKSTILNALAKSDVLAEDKLFATLDTTTRELWIESQRIGLISDTVGFIQRLPHLLIEAFKSTLAELQYADLLLHVVDLSDENWQEDIKIVHEILDELNVHKEMLYVFNKKDKVEDLDERLPLLKNYYPHVIISSLSKDSMKPLTDFLSNWKKQQ